ncbi:MAG: undecaprenyl-diphosphatase UppP [Thermoleophilia bacterium]|nr:undecaprenyl-diphosphatase UppP [Thermoleophilia bacterium]
MTILQAIILGIVQGLTEFLPISSSGHLILVPWLFHWEYLLENPDFNKTFDVALHFGTFVALVIYFWRDIGVLLAAWVRTFSTRRLDEPEGRLAWLIILSMIPAAIVGIALEDVIVNVLGAPWLIAAMLIVFGAVMWVVDRRSRKIGEVEDLRWRGALAIGLSQALALSPGVSRSGITMVTGLLVGLKREAAARFSFLMGIPIFGGATLYSGIGIAQEGLPPGMAAPFIAGMVAAALSGFAAVWFLLAYLRRHDFIPFAIYRFVVGGGALLLMAIGVRAAVL